MIMFKPSTTVYMVLTNLIWHPPLPSKAPGRVGRLISNTNQCEVLQEDQQKMGKLGDDAEKRNETKHKGEGDKPKHPKRNGLI